MKHIIGVLLGVSLILSLIWVFLSQAQEEVVTDQNQVSAIPVNITIKNETSGKYDFTIYKKLNPAENITCNLVANDENGTKLFNETIEPNSSATYTTNTNLQPLDSICIMADDKQCSQNGCTGDIKYSAIKRIDKISVSDGSINSDIIFTGSDDFTFPEETLFIIHVSNCNQNPKKDYDFYFYQPTSLAAGADCHDEDVGSRVSKEYKISPNDLYYAPTSALYMLDGNAYVCLRVIKDLKKHSTGPFKITNASTFNIYESTDVREEPPCVSPMSSNEMGKK